MGIQACRGTLELDQLLPEAIEQAIACWQYSFKSGCALVDAIAGHSDDSDALAAVLTVIKQERSISRSDLLRRTRMKARNLAEYTETLVGAGQVREEQQPSRGRTAVVFSYVG